jgi:hypothetical protein
MIEDTFTIMAMTRQSLAGDIASLDRDDYLKYEAFSDQLERLDRNLTSKLKQLPDYQARAIVRGWIGNSLMDEADAMMFALRL